MRTFLITTEQLERAIEAAIDAFSTRRAFGALPDTAKERAVRDTMLNIERGIVQDEGYSTHPPLMRLEDEVTE